MNPFPLWDENYLDPDVFDKVKVVKDDSSGAIDDKTIAQILRNDRPTTYASGYTGHIEYTLPT